MSPSSSLFVYGTLLADEVLAGLLSRVPAKRPAILRGFSRYCVRGQDFPAILRTPELASSHVEGALLQGLLPREQRALDFYEDELYEKTSVTVRLLGGAEASAERFIV